MTKTVYFIRHAKSSWADIGLRDIQRPLNKRGFRDAPFMAKLMRDRIDTIDQIVSSPAVRAKTTAAYFAKTFGIQEDQILLKDQIYEAYPNTLVNVVQGFSNKWNNVLIFGHNPGFTAIANEFSSYFIDNVPTCGIIRLDAAIRDWSDFGGKTTKLVEFHYPKQYFT